MQTKAGDPGAFAQFDLSRVDSPAFVDRCCQDAGPIARSSAEIRDEAASDGGRHQGLQPRSRRFRCGLLAPIDW